MTVVEERKRHCELHRVPVITQADWVEHQMTAHGGRRFGTCWLPVETDPTWDRRRWNP
jgi:hypothetical protein